LKKKCHCNVTVTVTMKKRKANLVALPKRRKHRYQKLIMPFARTLHYLIVNRL
jgi:hypothetical protein